MKKFEGGSFYEFNAEETKFYSDCQIYTSEIERCKKLEDNQNMCECDRIEACKERMEFENNRQMLIDEWKKEHGQYDYEKAYNTRIDGSKIPSQCYGNYWNALEEHASKDDNHECEEEEEYGM